MKILRPAGKGRGRHKLTIAARRYAVDPDKLEECAEALELVSCHSDYPSVAERAKRSRVINYHPTPATVTSLPTVRPPAVSASRTLRRFRKAR